MGLETATYIADLNSSNPVGASDNVSQGDDHIRLIKATLLATFPNFTGEAVTKTEAELNEATGLAELGFQFKVKSADEQVSTSTTFQDDNHLTGFTLSTGKFYKVEGWIAVTSTTAADFKHCLTFTDTPSPYSFGHRGYNTVSGSLNVDTTPGTGTIIGFASSSTAYFHVIGFFQANGTDGGTCKYQWAQNSASGTTDVLEGSWLAITQLD